MKFHQAQFAVINKMLAVADTPCIERCCPWCLIWDISYWITSRYYRVPYHLMILFFGDLAAEKA